ncbi:MAG: hypothetical protein HRT44_09875 [Bdellovibrionales bacterium]|nr:hypothetical protein [Bdellovibrionales bacterium]NQZ19547.1 hypothetical protein [Bdellovibrionales bacterium]
MNKIKSAKYLLMGMAVASLLILSGDAYAQSRKRKRMGNLTLQKLKSAVPPSKKIKQRNEQQRTDGLINPQSTNKI